MYKDLADGLNREICKNRILQKHCAPDDCHDCFVWQTICLLRQLETEAEKGKES